MNSRILTSYGWRNREPDDSELVNIGSSKGKSMPNSIEEHVMYTMHLPSFSSNGNGESIYGFMTYRSWNVCHSNRITGLSQVVRSDDHPSYVTGTICL